VFIRSFSCLCLLLFLPFPVLAAGWTGIAVFVGQTENDWLLSDINRQANIDFYGLRIEERTNIDLRVGITAGQFELRLLDALDVTLAEKYTGQFLSLYLRWPSQLSEFIRLHSQVKYQFHLGDKSPVTDNTDNVDITEISWTEASLDLGVSIQIGPVLLRPFINFRSIDGDITSTTQSRIFKQHEVVSQGVIMDFYVEPTAFVRLKAVNGGQQTVLISFAREY